MKKIDNGFKDYYYLTEDAKVYNAKSNIYLKEYRNAYNLVKEDGTVKCISKKVLYEIVYNKVLCNDQIVDLHNEEWRYIKGTEQKYMVSNYGRVKSFIGYEAKLLKQIPTNKGYYRVWITIDGEAKQIFVHRLVAAEFLQKPEGINLQIHHKDFCGFNNKSNNLEWLTIAEHRKKHSKEKKSDG